MKLIIIVLLLTVGGILGGLTGGHAQTRTPGTPVQQSIRDTTGDAQKLSDSAAIKRGPVIYALYIPQKDVPTLMNVLRNSNLPAYLYAAIESQLATEYARFSQQGGQPASGVNKQYHPFKSDSTKIRHVIPPVHQ